MTRNQLMALTAAAAAAGFSPAYGATAVTIMPLGASITAGQSAQTPYNGGGYRSGLYTSLANDGRYTVNYVGSDTNLKANNPTATNVLTTANQLRHEGHPGYTTGQVLNNLNASDGTSGNNGGFWLKAGNGVNPDVITLNVGGNDFVLNNTDTGAISRLDSIVTQLATLRPNATIVVSNITYRTDVGGFVDTYYNALIPRLVYNHVAAGQHVQFLDLRNALNTSTSTTSGDLSSDGVHPNQRGYDKMAGAWYQAIANGAAYWTGNGGPTWTTLGTGGASNWATNVAGTVDRGSAPNATAAISPDVHFVTNAGATILGQNLSVRGLNFAAGATSGVSLNGPDTLTLGVGGVTVQAGSGAHTIGANVAVGAAQTWTNVTANAFTVNGNLSGSGTLALAGGRFVLNGVNSLNQTTSVAGGATLAGNGTFAAAVEVASAGTLSPGDGLGAMTVGGVSIAGGGTLAVSLDGALSDVLNVTGAANVTGATLHVMLGATPLTAASFLVLNNDGTDAIVGRFANVATVNGVDQIVAGGRTFRVSYTGGSGNDLTLAVLPEPVSSAVILIGFGAMMMRRRRAAAE